MLFDKSDQPSYKFFNTNVASIHIDPETIDLFLRFYHSKTYSGELRVKLLDKFSIGSYASSLSLVMEKVVDYNTNNTLCNFFLEFTKAASYGLHPIKKQINFDNFMSKYSPGVNASYITKVLNEINPTVLDNLANDFFGYMLYITTNKSENDIINPSSFTLNKENTKNDTQNNINVLKLDDIPNMSSVIKEDKQDDNLKVDSQSYFKMNTLDDSKSAFKFETLKFSNEK